MKSCKIYCRECSQSFRDIRTYDAWLTDDGLVVLDHSPLKTPPSLTMDGRPYYRPAAGLPIEVEPFGVLLPFSVDGKWGYCDRWEGDVVIPARFSCCESFFPVPEGREIARFAVEGVPAPYGRTSSLFEDMDWVNDAPDGLWGYLGLDGSEVIPTAYQYLTPIEKGLILAKKDGLWGVLDTFGTEVSPIRWNAICFDEDYGFITREDTPGGSRYAIFDRFGMELVSGLPAMPERDGMSRYRRFPEPPEFDFDGKAREEWDLWMNWGHGGAGHCRYYYHDGEYGYLECWPERPGGSGEMHHSPSGIRAYIAHEKEVLDDLLHYRSHETAAIEKQQQRVKEVCAQYPEPREKMEETIDASNERMAQFLAQRAMQPWALEDDRLQGPGPWPRPCRVYPYDGEPIEGQLMPSGNIRFPTGYEHEPPHLLLPFEVDGKWGYCNAKRAVFPPQWGFCDHFRIHDIARFNLYGGYDPALSDFYSEEETSHDCPGCQGRWGFLHEDGWLVSEAFYQYVSEAFHGWRIAKKDGFWGLMNSEGEVWEDGFVWDDMWFRLGECSVVIAKKNTRHGLRYTIFTEDTGEVFASGLKYPDELYDLEEDEDE